MARAHGADVRRPVAVGTEDVVQPRRDRDCGNDFCATALAVGVADIIAIVAIVVLLACWGGVAFLPGRSMHFATDAIEPQLAGNWRGIFPHKNQAGAVMVLLVFFGLFYARVRSLPVGWAIIAAACVFLNFTQSKTSMALLPFAWLLSLAVLNMRKLWTRLALLLGFLAFFNLVTIGASVPGAVRSVVRVVLPDASYTGRTDLWGFALNAIAEKPIFGHGFGAFWRTEATMHRDRIVSDPDACERDPAHRAVARAQSIRWPRAHRRPIRGGPTATWAALEG